MVKRVIFRVEGNGIVGHGHFMRCLAMARHLKGEFDCVFVMSDPSDLALSELFQWGFNLLRTPSRQQYHPDHVLSNEPWPDDVSTWLESGDFLLLDGYRFDESFILAAHRVGARVIQVVDDFEALAGVDAVITSLPIEHELAVQRGLPNVLWTGIDGFLLRPEFFEREKAKVETEWEWFLYVSNGSAMNGYRGLGELRDSRVLALVTAEWTKPCQECGWDVLVHPPLTDLIRAMRSCEGAKLPASTIAIEYLVATGRVPEVLVFALNQEQGSSLFTNQGLWKLESFEKNLGASNKASKQDFDIQTSPQSNFLTWFHEKF